MNRRSRPSKKLILIVVGLLLVGGVAGDLLLRGKWQAAPVTTAAGDTAAGAASSTGPVVHASTTAGDTPQDPNAEKPKTPVPVSVAQIVSGDVSSYITSTGNLVPEDEVKVLAEAEGRVAELFVEEGDQVTRGMVLASLVKDDAEIALKKAEVRVGNARLAHERAVRAMAQDLLSREEFEKLSMEKDVAEQELAEANWKLAKTSIRSPFSGRLTEREIRLGQHVRLSDHLFTVADFDPLVARIYLPEKDIFGLSEGREVRITLKANETTHFDGRIRQISPVVDTNTGTVKVTVEAIKPPSEVRPGAFVTIGIVRETHARAMLLPRQAVIRELQDAYVFIAKGEVAERRAVALGLEEGDHIEALSGVSGGEQVIVAGQGGLKDGSPIKVMPPTEASDLIVPSGRESRS
ncbi:MAG TPA: efflux RND transporter periplasmic adaptor subunit [Candidatus Polarisedimenticolia bacterium]|nr:efflux RND transporter periplasmic adaptor subunit [Candidatus Polarisedimenticolia bacterium]